MKIFKIPPFHSGNMKGIWVVKIKNGTTHLFPKLGELNYQVQQFRRIKKFIQNPVVEWSYHKTKIPGGNCMNYHHLSIEERSCIRKYYVDGLSYREIARLIGRNISTISREIR